MDGVASSPSLSTRVPKRWGRHDYERFDNISSSQRVGHGRIGSVAVDCRFLFTKSQWGIIGDNMNPAGIVYLDLDFHQPADTRLRSATVLITLEKDERGGWNRQKARTSNAHGNQSSCAVKFTDNYGPKHFHGRERSMWTRREKHLTPNVNILGYGAGGIGLNTKQDSEKVSRWKFAGHLDSSKGSVWYNRLKWHLEENELESQSLHSNLVHTAFAFEHNASEFYMTVEVSGKLVGLSDRFRNKMMKFGGSNGKEHETVTTKFQWSNGYRCPKRLDRIAKALSYSMEYENLYEVPFEMPDTLPANFQTVAEPRTPEPVSPSNPEGRPWPPPRVSGSARPGLLEVPNAPQTNNEEPTLDELIMAGGFASTAEEPLTETPRNRPPASLSSATTLVGNGTEEIFMQDTRMKFNPGPVKTESENRVDDEQTDIEMIIWLSRIPLLTIILKLFASVMGFRSNQLDDCSNGDTDSESEAPTTANIPLDSFDSDAETLNTQNTDFTYGSRPIRPPMKPRKYPRLPVRLGRIDEVNPEITLEDEAQEAGLLEVPVRSR